MGRTKSEETCYMCDAPKTSMEHVPPICLFPAKKDLTDADREKGVDYRKEPIKVPSCKKHNSDKSKIDELMLIYFSACKSANEVGKSHISNKLARIMQRPQKNKLFSELFMNSSPILISEEGQIKQSISLSVESTTFYDHLECMANGLYFDYFKKRTTGLTKVWVVSGVRNADGEANDEAKAVKRLFESDFEKVKSNGHNQDVFHYKMISNGSDSILLMTFYGAIEFIACFDC